MFLSESEAAVVLQALSTSDRLTFDGTLKQVLGKVHRGDVFRVLCGVVLNLEVLLPPPSPPPHIADPTHHPHTHSSCNRWSWIADHTQSSLSRALTYCTLMSLKPRAALQEGRLSEGPPRLAALYLLAAAHSPAPLGTNPFLPYLTEVRNPAPTSLASPGACPDPGRSACS